MARAAVGDETSRCVQELLAQGVDLRQHTSVACATDLVALVQALDDETFNLYGISCGTRLALVTMRVYPNAGIRSVILDSTYPVGLPGCERYPSEPHEVVMQIFADCHLDPVCNAACPNLQACFIALLAALEAQPFVVNDEITVTADDVAEVMQVISSAVAMAPYIPQMIAGLEAGDAMTCPGIVSGELLTPASARAATPEAALPALATPDAATLVVKGEEAQAAALREVVRAFMHGIGIGDTSQALTSALAFLSEVTFAIYQLSTGPANELTVRLLLLDQLPATRATLAQFVERAFTDPVLAGEQAPLRQIFAACKLWPGGRAPSYANLPVSSDLPTLSQAGTYDMQAPLSWNTQAFVTFPNTGLVIAPMSGHGVLAYHQECITQIAGDFLDNPVSLPDDSCVAAYYPEWALPDAT